VAEPVALIEARTRTARHLHSAAELATMRAAWTAETGIQARHVGNHGLSATCDRIVTRHLTDARDLQATAADLLQAGPTR
jgi:hypothetical protein